MTGQIYLLIPKRVTLTINQEFSLPLVSQSNYKALFFTFHLKNHWIKKDAITNASYPMRWCWFLMWALPFHPHLSLIAFLRLFCHLRNRSCKVHFFRALFQDLIQLLQIKTPKTKKVWWLGDCWLRLRFWNEISAKVHFKRHLRKFKQTEKFIIRKLSHVRRNSLIILPWEYNDCQFIVIVEPSPDDAKTLYLESILHIPPYPQKFSSLHWLKE